MLTAEALSFHFLELLNTDHFTDCAVTAHRRFDVRGCLRASPVVENRGFVDARDGAERGARFLRVVFADDVGLRVFGQRRAGKAALLRAVMD